MDMPYYDVIVFSYGMLNRDSYIHDYLIHFNTIDFNFTLLVI
jgi:hypothetical protein